MNDLKIKTTPETEENSVALSAVVDKGSLMTLQSSWFVQERHKEICDYIPRKEKKRRRTNNVQGEEHQERLF